MIRIQRRVVPAIRVVIRPLRRKARVERGRTREIFFLRLRTAEKSSTGFPSSTASRLPAADVVSFVTSKRSAFAALSLRAWTSPGLYVTVPATALRIASPMSTTPDAAAYRPSSMIRRVSGPKRPGCRRLRLPQAPPMA